jgi:Flp pilus assembly protein TadG
MARSDERGASIVEFAVVLPVLVVLLLGVADFGLYLMRRLQLNAALEAGVLYVTGYLTTNGWSDSNPSSAADIANVVTKSAVTNGTITVTNQGAGMCSYHCLISGQIDLSTGVACTDGAGKQNFYSCTSGVIGKYVTINARLSGPSIFSNRLVNLYPIDQSVIVKIQ